MSELKPYPFCGGEAHVKEYANGHKGDGTYTASYQVGCDKCKIYFNRNSEFRFVNGQPKFDVNGYDLAVGLWNTRAVITDNSENVDSFVL